MKTKIILVLTSICFIFASLPAAAVEYNYKNLEIVHPYEPITYHHMVTMIEELEENFSELVTWESLGKSWDNRDIILLKLGKGDTLIHINGSVHARERITTNIILKNIEDYCNAYYSKKIIKRYDVKKLLDQVTIYFVPMANPDGVDYTILGEAAVRDATLRENLASIASFDRSPYFSGINRWKANIKGVDINKQWNFGWEEKELPNPMKPSNSYYKGAYPHSEPETQALETLSLKHPFMIYCSYHTQGSLFYWYKYQTMDDLAEVIHISKKITHITGFQPFPSYSSIPKNFSSYKGFTDWTAAELKKPSFTIEFARGSYSEKNFDKIYEPSIGLPLMLAEEALELRQQYKYWVYFDEAFVQRFKRLEDAINHIEKYKNPVIHGVVLKNGNTEYVSPTKSTSDTNEI
ncbi:MAG: peptidase carboxypeptidase [Anaerosolibacter sp.]|uniref:M14 family metallopeptidase n=1 Tax=Anaerosolibacter sp. TaxID=1872527 RepID=UPI002626048B|nr:M14 family metallocarboxypeptidase [Anaerosolibacter sp.]MDF2547834.1 peptidase carboxypeptidase [Anaerosolibacter sp.]